MAAILQGTTRVAGQQEIINFFCRIVFTCKDDDNVVEKCSTIGCIVFSRSTRNQLFPPTPSCSTKHAPAGQGRSEKLIPPGAREHGAPHLCMMMNFARDFFSNTNFACEFGTRQRQFFELRSQPVHCLGLDQLLTNSLQLNCTTQVFKPTSATNVATTNKANLLVWIGDPFKCHPKQHGSTDDPH